MHDLIDHKDEAGEYRDSVRDTVLSQFSIPCSIVTNREEMVGTWRWRASIPPVGEVVTEYRFLPTGRFTSKMSRQPQQVSSDKNKWELNQDGTFSLHYWFDADHSTVVGRAGFEESRYYLRALADGRRVLWNCDGSVVLILEQAV